MTSIVHVTSLFGVALTLILSAQVNSSENVELVMLLYISLLAWSSLLFYSYNERLKGTENPLFLNVFGDVISLIIIHTSIYSESCYKLK